MHTTQDRIPGNYQSDLRRQDFQGVCHLIYLSGWQISKPAQKTKTSLVFQSWLSGRRKYELLPEEMWLIAEVKSVKQPDDWHGKGRLGKSLPHWKWKKNHFSQKSAGPELLWLWLSGVWASAILYNLKACFWSHLNTLNYCATIRCYGLKSRKCFRLLWWNFEIFADAAILNPGDVASLENRDCRGQ